MYAAAQDKEINPAGGAFALAGSLWSPEAQAGGTAIDAALGFLGPEAVTEGIKTTGDLATLVGLVDTNMTLYPPDECAPPSSTGTVDSGTNYDSKGNVLAPAIGVSTTQLQITATANSASVMADLTVINNGSIGSTLVYSIQGSLSGGSITFSTQPSNLEYNQTDDYVVTVSVPGGFTAGKTYTGSIVVSASDPNVKNNPVTVAVTVTVPAPAAVISASPNPLDISAEATSTSATAGFTVTNTGPQGSTLVYSLQGSLNGGSIGFSKQPSNLGSQQSDNYTVTVTVPGGFVGGQSYSGSITISSTDPDVSSVTVPVNVTVPSQVQVFSGLFTGSGNYTTTLGTNGSISYYGTGVMTVTPVSGGYSIHITTPNSIEATSGYGNFAITLDATVTDPTFTQFSWTVNAGADGYNCPLTISGTHSGSTVSNGHWGFSLNVEVDGIGETIGGSGTYSLTLQQSEEMAASQLPSGTTDTLAQNALAPIVAQAQAIAPWQAASLPAQDVSRPSGSNVQAADLPGSSLGVATANGSRIDKSAAAHGWFVDPTPHDDAEFTQLATDTLAAWPNSTAVDHVFASLQGELRPDI